jgi:hypothetical protein
MSRFVLTVSNGLLTQVTDSGSGSSILTIPNTVTGYDTNFSLGNVSTVVTELNFEPVAQITTFVGGGLSSSQSLTKITIPNSVTRIPNQYFRNCTNLQTIVLDGTPILGANCFLECPNILFDSLLELVYKGYSAGQFNGDLYIAGITNEVIDGLPNLVISDSVLTNVSYSNSSHPIIYFKVPNTVTSISISACQNQTFIGSLIIPSTVTRILADSFLGCSNLTLLTLPGFRTSSSNSLIPLDANSFALATSPSLIRSAVNVVSLQQLRTQGYSVTQLEAAGFQNVPITCFGENTKIMCFIDGREQELMVQDIRNGVLVKTFKSGYKPVCMIGTNKMNNPGNDERIKERLYICKKEKYPELTEDLIITGCHSILLDKITDEQRGSLLKEMGDIYVTEGKYRLTAAIDERAKPYNCAGEFNIYHFALEHDIYVANYGVYANGLLVETCSKRYLAEIANMTMLN